MINLQTVNNYLVNNSIDAWIIYDFKGSNSIVTKFIGDKHFTRRLFLVLPKNSKPYIICHTIDAVNLNAKEVLDTYSIITYNTWQELNSIIETHFKNYTTVIMEVSDLGLLPNVSSVDYGTVEFVKQYVKQVLSSKDILTLFNSALTNYELETHKTAMAHLVEIKDSAFKIIEQNLNAGKKITEYDVQKYILAEYKKRNLVADSGPVVAVNQNAGMPHYEPSKDCNSVINKGDTILIDLWAKINNKNCCYADITWVAYAGSDIPTEYQNAFDVIKKSIEVGIEYLNNNLNNGVRGCDLDDVIRNYIKDNNYGKYFIHRVGHNIYTDFTPHGKGVNIDNYESCDTRLITNNTCFSIEPGIYTKTFGVRQEINVCIINNKVVISSPIQKEIITMNLN